MLFQSSCSTFLIELQGLETPAKTGAVSVDTSLGNSPFPISSPVGKAKLMRQKGKLRCAKMKLLTVTGNRRKIIILIGGAHCISEVVRNLKFVMNCSAILCLSYLCSLQFSSTWMSGAVSYNDVRRGKPSFCYLGE